MIVKLISCYNKNKKNNEYLIVKENDISNYPNSKILETFEYNIKEFKKIIEKKVDRESCIRFKLNIFLNSSIIDLNTKAKLKEIYINSF